MSMQALTWAKNQKVNNSGAKFVLFILADYAGADGGSCFPKISTLADDTSQNQRTVRRHLEHLEINGFISRKRQRNSNGSYGRYTYVLNLCREYKTELEEPADNLTSGQFDQWTKTTLPADNLSGPYIDEPPIEPSIKKQKGFLDLVFKNYGESAEIEQHALACWDYWLAYPHKRPTGDLIAAFKGWMRNAKPKSGFAGKQGNPSTSRSNTYSRDKPANGRGAGLNEMDRQRVKGYYESGFWLPQFGEKPDHPDCRIDPAIIQEFQNQPEKAGAS